MSQPAGPPSPQSTPTTAAEAPATLAVQTFEIACVDDAAVIHFFSGSQPPAAATLTPDLLRDLIRGLQDALHSLEGG